MSECLVGQLCNPYETFGEAVELESLAVQKINFIASCICRFGVAVLPITPALPVRVPLALNMLPLGSPKLV